MSSSTNEVFRRIINSLTKEEKLIVLEALERHLSERETVLSPDQ